MFNNNSNLSELIDEDNNIIMLNHIIDNNATNKKSAIPKKAIRLIHRYQLWLYKYILNRISIIIQHMLQLKDEPKTKLNIKTDDLLSLSNDENHLSIINKYSVFKLK